MITLLLITLLLDIDVLIINIITLGMHIDNPVRIKKLFNDSWRK